MMTRRSLTLFALCLCASSSHSQVPSAIRDPSTAGYTLRAVQKRFAIGLEQLKAANTMSPDSAGAGLFLDLGDTTLFGRVHSGPAYFDQNLTDYPETRFRFSSDITRGRATITINPYFDSTSRSNANGWVDRGIIGYRLDLLRLLNGRPVTAGVFDSRVHCLRKGDRFVPIVSIFEGPMVGVIQSDHPDWVAIGYGTDRPSVGGIELRGGKTFWSDSLGEQHEIRVIGLRPATTYFYRAVAVADGDTASTPWLRFTSAPRKGEGKVVFAYAGDGRAASGGGEYEYAGVNRWVGSQIARQIFRNGSSFFLFGGDLTSGYINSPEEFRLELMAFRESYAPLLHAVPFYTAMGNHEALLNIFDDGSRRGFSMDKWPYTTSSAEAIFAQVMIQPTDGPRALPGRPPYEETAYAFQYGSVKVIVINNDYWVTSRNRITEFGGSPEGYILPEQMDWFASELKKADKDTTVRSVVILAHEPAFPGGGHVGDAMWHSGDNNRRAYKQVDGQMKSAGPGIVEVRNQFWSLASKSRKVAVVLGSDEHNYQRYLITNRTPAGVPQRDDLNGNGILDDGVFSADPDFRYPTWFIISGGAGAPYYGKESAPWSGSSKFFTPQCNYILFRAEGEKLGMEVYASSGQLLDKVDDLLRVKR